jgi:hypothetical protein
MNWNTIYITGKTDFWEDVKDELSGAKVKHIVGSVEHLPEGSRGLYWLGEKENLEDFKRAIGAKLIWKYRLRFQLDAEITNSSTRSTRDRFTERERSLIQKMRLKSRRKATVK